MRKRIDPRMKGTPKVEEWLDGDYFPESAVSSGLLRELEREGLLVQHEEMWEGESLVYADECTNL